MNNNLGSHANTSESLTENAHRTLPSKYPEHELVRLTKFEMRLLCAFYLETNFKAGVVESVVDCLRYRDPPNDKLWTKTPLIKLISTIKTLKKKGMVLDSPKRGVTLLNDFQFVILNHVSVFFIENIHGMRTANMAFRILFENKEALSKTISDYRERQDALRSQCASASHPGVVLPVNDKAGTDLMSLFFEL